MTATIAQICRYPVKGLNAESLERVSLTPNQSLPNDRRFAVAHDPVGAGTDRDPGAWQPPRAFLQLKKNEKLAQLHARFDEAEGILTIERRGKQVARGKVTEPLGRTLIGQFFSGYMADELRGAPRLLEARAQPFTDTDEPVISVIGLASIADLERVVREPLDRRRFRANIYIEGAPAWSELDWVGREATLGEARLRIESRIDRCAATNVNPETAARDLNIPLTLQRGFGHIDMGVYARVLEPGSIATGDRLVLD